MQIAAERFQFRSGGKRFRRGVVVREIAAVRYHPRQKRGRRRFAGGNADAFYELEHVFRVGRLVAHVIIFCVARVADVMIDVEGLPRLAENRAQIAHAHFVRTIEGDVRVVSAAVLAENFSDVFEIGKFDGNFVRTVNIRPDAQRSKRALQSQRAAHGVAVGAHVNEERGALLFFQFCGERGKVGLHTSSFSPLFTLFSRESIFAPYSMESSAIK